MILADISSITHIKLIITMLGAAKKKGVGNDDIQKRDDDNQTPSFNVNFHNNVRIIFIVLYCTTF